MRMKLPFAALLILLTAGALAAPQDPAVQDAPAAPEPLFVRLTFYPTASLSRYDYNNDLDLYEVRVYAEVRRGSQEGPPAADARVTAFAQKLDFLEDHFEKRVLFDKDKLPCRARPRDLRPGPARHPGAASPAGLARHHAIRGRR
ncbi:MAG: hypothetical protein M0C28_35660 [Candidatus Moduliflexus flocculans]|nr:hypothetical protein [Candidatus Moduliflexus flocculans]